MSLMDMIDRLMGREMHEEDMHPAYHDLLEREDYEGALPLLREAVRRDDARAMTALGSMLVVGQSIEQDVEEGVLWLRQAAVRGDLRGQYCLGSFLAAGLGVARNDEEAAFWLYQASRGGLRDAVEALSNLALRNPAVVGEHFSMDDLVVMVGEARKVAPLSIN